MLVGLACSIPIMVIWLLWLANRRVICSALGRVMVIRIARPVL